MLRLSANPPVGDTGVKSPQSSLDRRADDRTVKASTPTRRSVDNGNYQRRLAALLLETMDIHDAIQFCLEQGWEQTLLTISTNKSPT
jgi:hypothetical protein